MNTQSVQNAGQSEAAADAPTEDMEFDADLDAAISAMDGAPADDAAATGEREEQQQSAAEARPPLPMRRQMHLARTATLPAGFGHRRSMGKCPAELREARERELRDWDLRFRSANGRVSALQRQLAQYQQQTQQQPAQQQEPQRETQQPEQRPSGINLTDPKFQQLREDFPEVAGPLLDVIADLSSQLGSVRQVAGTFEQQQTQAFLAQQEQTLAQAHPDGFRPRRTTDLPDGCKPSPPRFRKRSSGTMMPSSTARMQRLSLECSSRLSGSPRRNSSRPQQILHRPRSSTATAASRRTGRGTEQPTGS
ncbi:hypothetical protein C7W88_00045 [Novosphingobium sp. THN1]|nr:hypothetical protein C7W88_00045 [Novosphingobium sp. THN1]